MVDDNLDAAFAISALLGIEGHEVQSAHDGVEGFDAAQRFLPRIAILDLDMPRRGGLELARLIKAQDWGKPMLLIALTGHSGGDVRRTALENGFDQFFSKPVDPESLFQMIQQLLSESSSPGSSESH